jgi:hypothetical protein
MLKAELLLSSEKIGTDGSNTVRSTIKTSIEDGLLRLDPDHYVSKYLQHGTEEDDFIVKQNMPRIGGSMRG